MNHSETKKLIVTTGASSPNVFGERVLLLNEVGIPISTKSDAELNSRFGPSVFTVDSYLASLSGTTPATATSAQTIAAFDAANTAAAAVRGKVVFTAGQTYQIDTTFKLKTGVTYDMTSATLKKRSTTGKGSPLIVNEDWAAGNTDIVIIAHGAVWDWNGRVLASGTGEPYGGIGDCAHFQNVTRFKIAGRPLIKDASKYAIQFGQATDVDVDGAIFDTRSDGCHLTGPIRRFTGGTFSGTTGDDFFAMSSSEYSAQKANIEAFGGVGEGDIIDVNVACLQIANDVLPTGGGSYGSGLAVLGGWNTSPDYWYKNIHVGVVTGRTKKALRVTVDAILTNLNVVDVTVDKIACDLGSGTPNQVLIEPKVMESLTIGELRNADTGSSQPVLINGGTTGSINIGRFINKASTTAIAAIFTAATAVVGEINIGSVDAIYGTNGRLYQHNSTTACTLNITNWKQSGAGWGVFSNNSAGALTVNVGNAYLAGLTQVARVDAATMYLFAANMTLDNCVQFLNLNTATSVMRFVAGSMRQVASSDRGITLTAGALLSATGPSFRVPVDTKLTTSSSLAGDIVYNSVAATTGLGLAQFNGTSWVLV